MSRLTRPSARSIVVILIAAGVAVAHLPPSSAAEDAADLIRRGVAERKAGQDKAAVALLRQAVRLAPDDPNARIEAARALWSAWEACYQEFGAKDIGRSLWLAPADWRLHAKPPYRWSVLGEQGLPTSPTYDEALPIEVVEMREVAEAAHRLDPTNPVALAVAGFAAASCNDAEGFNRLPQAVRSAPTDPTVRMIFAAYLFNGGAKSGAGYNTLREIEEAARLAPDDTNLRLMFAACRYAKGERQKASDEVDDVLKKEPQSFAGHRARCEVLVGAARYREAVAELTECLRIRPKDTQLFLRRATLETHLGQYDEALQDLDRCTEVTPENHVADASRFAIYRKLGRHDEVLQINDRQLARFPYSPLHHKERAAVLADLGRTDEALREKKRSDWLTAWLKQRRKIRDEPESAAHWIAGGEIAVLGEEWEAAKACFTIGVERTGAPREAISHAGLAKVRLALGEYRDAVEAATRAIEQREAFYESEKIGPNARHGLGLEHLNAAESIRADAYLALGDLDAAIADYEATRAFGEKPAKAYRLRAEKREAAGDTEGAAEDRDHAKALDPFAAAAEPVRQ